MFGIKVRDKDDIKKKETLENNEEPFNDKNKYYIEINPKTEIVRVENKEQLKSLQDLKEIKKLPNKLPELVGEEACGHWERRLVFLSESNPELFRKTRDEMITGGYCPDCGADLGQPKPKWCPRTYYNKKTGV